MKKIIALIIFVLLGLTITGCELEKEEEYKYKLNLYNLNEIESVTISTMSQYENSVIIKDNRDIKVIYYIFAGKQTNTESTSENPENPDTLYSVTFNTENESKTVYIYRKDENYYLENPKYGIYDSSEEDYNKIEKIVKENTYAFTIRNFEFNEITSVTVSTLGQFDEPVVLNEKKDIKILYNIFSAKQSNVSSENYNPVDHGELLHVIFTNDSYETRDFYIYKKYEKYYIEESLYAIFNSNESEFQIVKNYTESSKEVEE